MSDDEMMPPVVGGDDDVNLGGEDFDEDMGSADEMGDELPEGVKKEVITESGGSNWKRPKAGDEVSVHYVGTLESDGSEFDSSRGRNQPFVFTLGRGQVIQGWDLGVATMKKGEVAKFTLAPEFAYGDEGSPPKIPAKATLVFEVELLGWKSKDDLFGDEGVIKTEIKEGSGFKSAKLGDEVLLSLKTSTFGGESSQEWTDFEYVIGSSALGPFQKVVDKALTVMKRGEEVELKCSKEYVGEGHPDGAILSLTLQEIYDVKDVSFAQDRSVMKKTIRAGEGYDIPKDTAKISVKVETATDGSSPLPSFQAQTLEFLLGNGQVCDAVECVAGGMKRGERAVLTVISTAQFSEEKLGLKNIAADKVMLTIEMVDFEKVKETWDMSDEEKVEFATARKEVGTALFKAGRFALALQRYKKISDLFMYIDNYPDEIKAMAKSLKTSCQLNQAAVQLKMQDFAAAKKVCDTVLKDDKHNVKALYRRAQAELGLKNFQECLADCKKVVEIDKQNKEARALHKQAQELQKEEDKKAKGLFANMCKALGKGPIPEPVKASSGFGECDDDDRETADEEMPSAEQQEAQAGESGNTKMEE